MIRFLPAWLTAHRAVLLGLAALVGAAFVVSATDDEFGYLPSQLLKSLVVAVVVTAVVTYACAAIVAVPPNSDSWLITGLILFFVMPVAVDDASLRAVVIGSAAAAVSKYVLVWRRRLIVNPAVVGALTCYALIHAEVGDLSYLPWWVAAQPLMVPMMLVGIVVITAVGDWPLAIAYLTTALVTTGIVADLGQDNIELVLKSYPTLFIAVFMLPEPLTSPATRIPRLAYGVLVGVLMFWQQTFEITDGYTLTFDPEVALGVGCLFAFLVRLVNRTARRVPIGVRTQQIAPATYAIDADESLRFRPGQWATLAAPRWSTPLWTSSRRVFSFASATETPARFAFTVGTPASSYKAGLIERSPQRVFVDNRGGDFVVSPRLFTRGRLVLVASGIGITPFAAMLHTWLDAGADLSRVVVVHVVRAADRAVYTDLLAQARAAGAQVREIVTTDPIGADALVPTAGSDLPVHYFVSGAPGFVGAAAAVIRRHDPATRLYRWRVHTDSFTGY